jgi:hypothetical protein
VQRTFLSPEGLSKWVNAHRCAALKAFPTSSQSEIIFSRSEYNSLDPSRVYGIFSPFHPKPVEDIRHNQMADKAFEAKCRLALGLYLSDHGRKITEHSRELIEPGETDTLIEWDGLFIDQENMYYLLECKHFMTTVVPL